jgi:hypothetical protein
VLSVKVIIHKMWTKLELNYNRLKRRNCPLQLLPSVRPSVHPTDQRSDTRKKKEVTQTRSQDMTGRIEGFNLDELYENNSRVVQN